MRRRDIGTQLGVEPVDEIPGPVAYGDATDKALTREVWDRINSSGSHGATSKEIASDMKKTQKSISGRCTELRANGLIRRSEAKRHGTVYIAVEGRRP